jgi:LSD1 subclass zinc finger protein
MGRKNADSWQNRAALSTTAFSRTFRLLLCKQCGAPLQLPPEGGSVQCSYCGTTSQLVPKPRVDPALFVKQRVDEATRYQKLRMQDASTPAVPPGLEPYLIADGTLNPAMTAHAFQDWQRTYAEVQGGAPFGSQDRLQFLTRHLFDSYVLANDVTRGRALIESSMELLDSAPIDSQAKRPGLAGPIALAAVIGGPGVLIGVGFIVASFFTAPGALTDDGYPLDSFFLMMGAIFSITFPIGPAIVVLFAIRRRARFDRFMRIGLDATGRVIGAERTNLKVNGVPQYELRLRVIAASRPPYEVSVKELVPTMQMHSLMGSNIPIKIDPQDRNSVFMVPR